MGLPSAILNPGLSDDTNFALELDTKMRFENMFNNMQDPVAFPIPEQRLPQSEFTANKDSVPVTMGEALLSPDRKTADLANQHLQRSLDNNVVTKYGLGIPNVFAYSPEMDKYLNQDAGYNPYISMAANEQFYYNRYLEKGVIGRSFTNIGVGLGRFAGSVGLKLANTAGLMGSMVTEGLWELFHGGDSENNAMANIADNSLSRWAESAEKDMKNTAALSVFKPNDWDDKGFFSKLGNAAFWTDEVADGAAFLGEMVASTYLLGGLGKVAGLSKLGAMPLKTGSKMLDWGVKALTGADDIAGIGRWGFMTSSEAAMESAGKYHSIKDDLYAQRNLGKNTLTNEQIETEASKAASSAFKDNMLILGISNSFTNRFIFEPILGKTKAFSGLNGLAKMSKSTANIDELAKLTRGNYAYRTKVGKILNLKDPGGRLRFYGGRAVGGTITEGYWEENAQLAAERLASDNNYVEGDMGTRFIQLMTKTGKQALSALPFKELTGAKQDIEAETSIGLGALISGAATTLIAKVAPTGGKIFEGERRAKAREADEVIAKYEKQRREFLSFQELHVRDKDGKLVLDEFGNMQIDEPKALALMAGLTNMSDKLNKLSTIEDAEFRKYAQQDSLINFVTAAKAAGVYDKVVKAFQRIPSIPGEEIMNLGFDPTTTVDPGRLISSFEKAGKMYDKYIAPKALPKLAEGQTIAEEFERRYQLYDTSVRLDGINDILQSYQQSIEDDQYLTIPSSEKTYRGQSDPQVQEYNLLKARLLKLDRFEEPFKGVSDFYNDYLADERANIKAKIETLDNILNPKIEKGELRAVSGFLEVPGRDYTIGMEAAHMNKMGDFQNLQSQYNFFVGKFSGPTGIEHMRAMKEHYSKIRKEDDKVAEAAKKDTEPVAEGKEDGTIDVKIGGEVVATTDKVEEAEPLVDALTKRVEEDKAAEEAATLAQQQETARAAQEAADAEATQQQIEDQTATYEQLLEAAVAILSPIADVNAGNIIELIPRLPALLQTQMGQELDLEEQEVILQLIEAHKQKLLEKVQEKIPDPTDPAPDTDDQLQAAIDDLESRRAFSLQIAGEEELGVIFDEGMYHGVYYGPGDVVAGTFSDPSLEEVQRQINEAYDRELAALNASQELTQDQKDFQEENKEVEDSQPPTEQNVEGEEFVAEPGVIIEGQPPIPPILPPITTEQAASLPPSLIDEVREAYELHEKAMLNDTSFEAEYKREGLIGANNKINEAVALSKNQGKVTFTTSSPSELQKGAIFLGADNMGLARHNFLTTISSNPELMNNFMISINLSAAGNLYAIITDLKGAIVKFGEDGSIQATGMPLSFYLDTDTYKAGNLERRRSDLFKLEGIFKGISTKTGFAVQGFGPLTEAPIILHPSFLENGEPRTDVIDQIKEKIKSKTGPVLATIDSVLQGMLVREGVDNSFQIPKTTPSQTATSLIEKGHVQDVVGDIQLDDTVATGIYQRANRINFRLFRDLENHSAGTELVEFITPTIQNTMRADGKSLFDTTVMIGDSEHNIFEAGIEGFLPADKDNYSFLKAVLRPDKFFVLNTGNTLLILDLKKFKKFVNSDNISAEELRSLTSVEDIKNSSLNIFKTWYDERGAIDMFDGVLPSDSYTDFINNNVKTSAQTVDKGNTEGYTRINQRIILTLDDNFEEMQKRNKQEEQLGQSKEVTVVTPSEPMSEKDILDRLQKAKDITIEQLDDDATNIDC